MVLGLLFSCAGPVSACRSPGNLTVQGEVQLRASQGPGFPRPIITASRRWAILHYAGQKLRLRAERLGQGHSASGAGSWQVHPHGCSGLNPTSLATSRLEPWEGQGA